MRRDDDDIVEETGFTISDLKATRKEKPRSEPGMMGIDSVSTVPAGCTVPLFNRPQCMFRIERLYVRSECAHFDINAVRIGNWMQSMVDATPIPAEIFTDVPRNPHHQSKTYSLIQHLLEGRPDVMAIPKDKLDDLIQIGHPISGNVAMVGHDVMIVVTNPMAYAMRFRGVYIGTMIND